MPHAFYTRREAAAHARISLRHLERLIAAHAGPTVTRLGARVLIRNDHLAEWLERLAEPNAARQAA